MKKYVAFLRGINVGGHHKLPMAELKTLFAKLGYKNTVTLLNSGNVVFEARESDPKKLENTIGVSLEKHFGFPVPTIVRTSSFMAKLMAENPFNGIDVTKDIRLYVSFLKEDVEPDIQLPWYSSDESYKILTKIEQTIVSVLDISVTKTPKAMEALEKFYSKDITTRNWNTIQKTWAKLES